MRVFRFAGDVFLLPGEMVRRSLNITVDQDGGLIRSFVNMVFWGTLVLTYVVLIH